ncbi:MAG: alpha/beta hydrolase [Candidatus Acidiferrales bacterium]
MIASRVLGKSRTIRVRLPAGYDHPANAERRYPVLYMNDGQNLFDVATSVFNRMEWRADETLRELTGRDEIQPMIIVGVDSAGRRGRGTEYLPYEDEYLRPAEPNPRGKYYPRFLTEELLPLVNHKYRTKTDPASTGIGGSSYGALAALYAGMTRPDVFGRMLLESPSLYVGGGKILSDAKNTKAWPEKIYLGVGTNEGGRPNCSASDPTPEAVADVKKLETVLKAAPNSPKLLTVVEQCAVHNENAWAKRLPDALRFLFASQASAGTVRDR